MDRPQLQILRPREANRAFDKAPALPLLSCHSLARKIVDVPHPCANLIKQLFREAQDVKSASARRETSLTSLSYEPDIVVETWMNSRLYAYIIDRPPKSRALKATLKQNSNASIGSLFLVNLKLLPEDGYCGRLQGWQDDLRALNIGAIQAYELSGGDLRLAQVNLDETTQRNQFVAWHTRDFPLEAVSVRRRDCQTNIRGHWYVGDIASPRFKRRISEERAQQRFHYHTRQSQPADMESGKQISAAYLALEIEVGAGQEAVKEAFRKLARQYHPDVSEHQKEEAEQRFKEVKSAYDRIRSHRRWS